MQKNKYTSKTSNPLNKGGRPKIGEGLTKQEKERHFFEVKRSERLNLRFTKFEKEKIDKKYRKYLFDNKLEKSQLSLSVFIIKTVLNNNFKAIYQDNNLSKMSFDINKIGVNINQITKRINSYSHINNHKIQIDLQELKSKLNNIYIKLDKK